MDTIVKHGQYDIKLCDNGDISISHNESVIVWVENTAIPSVQLYATENDEPRLSAILGQYDVELTINNTSAIGENESIMVQPEPTSLNPDESGDVDHLGIAYLDDWQYFLITDLGGVVHDTLATKRDWEAIATLRNGDTIREYAYWLNKIQNPQWFIARCTKADYFKAKYHATEIESYAAWRYTYTIRPLDGGEPISGVLLSKFKFEDEIYALAHLVRLGKIAPNSYETFQLDSTKRREPPDNS